MNLHHEFARYLTRRHFFRDCGVGLGAIALAELIGRDAARADQSKNPLAPKKPHHAPKAKAVIYLHMAGSPSQLDLFDYKSELVKFNGKPCPKEYLEGQAIRVHSRGAEHARHAVQVRQARPVRSGAERTLEALARSDR